jgi:hypothetical protein
VSTGSSWTRSTPSTPHTALAAGGLLVVDEIDASLHPNLTALLIQQFRSSWAVAHGAQLLFTTHDATLLGTSFGEEVLGRDEVWFVDKGATGDFDQVWCVLDVDEFRFNRAVPAADRDENAAKNILAAGLAAHPSGVHACGADVRQGGNHRAIGDEAGTPDREAENPRPSGWGEAKG